MSSGYLMSRDNRSPPAIKLKLKLQNITSQYWLLLSLYIITLLLLNQPAPWHKSHKAYRTTLYKRKEILLWLPQRSRKQVIPFHKEQNEQNWVFCGLTSCNSTDRSILWFLTSNEYISNCLSMQSFFHRN